VWINQAAVNPAGSSVWQNIHSDFRLQPSVDALNV